MEKIDVECLSRLSIRNIVYKIKIANNYFILKEYMYGNASERYNIEKIMYDYFRDNHIVKVPEFYNFYSNSMQYFLFEEFIDGTSLKKVTDEDLIKYVPIFLDSYNKIWQIGGLQLPTEKIGIESRLKSSEKDIFEKISSFSLNIDVNKLFKIYRDLLSRYNNVGKNVINSDISAHEAIISKNSLYFIDFENFKIGDVNNDLARSYYSLISNRNSEIRSHVLSLITDSRYYDPINFLYFITEKFISNIYVTNGDIADSEKDYFNYFINEEYRKKILVKH